MQWGTPPLWNLPPCLPFLVYSQFSFITPLKVRIPESGPLYLLSSDLLPPSPSLSHLILEMWLSPTNWQFPTMSLTFLPLLGLPNIIEDTQVSKCPMQYFGHKDTKNLFIIWNSNLAECPVFCLLNLITLI